MIENKQKGITLISLIVTIIVLLILAVISISSVIGENGIIARAKESRILTILADILFNLESNIIDINTDNILNDKKMVSSEMMDELINRKLIESKSDYEGFWGFKESIQYKVKGTNIENFFVSYNGDVWLDNYKRGKIQLTTNVDTTYTQDAQTKITVIDGTVEEFVPNEEYFLHAIEGRDDFICWVNQYGEIVSYFTDTIINVENRKEVEYTAIYNYDWRFENRILIGMDNNVSSNGSKIDMDLNITFLNGACVSAEYLDDEYVTTYNVGVGIVGMSTYISPNYEDLIGIADANEDYKVGDIELGLRLYNRAHRDCIDGNKDIGEEYFTDLTALENDFSEMPEPLGVGELNGSYLPVWNYEDLKFFSNRYCVSAEIDYEEIMRVYQDKYESIDRLYYRSVVYMVATVWELDENRELQLYYDESMCEDGESYFTSKFWDPTIKYVDL